MGPTRYAGRGVLSLVGVSLSEDVIQLQLEPESERPPQVRFILYAFV